jgi:hypothetical protein
MLHGVSKQASKRHSIKKNVYVCYKKIHGTLKRIEKEIGCHVLDWIWQAEDGILWRQ